MSANNNSNDPGHVKSIVPARSSIDLFEQGGCDDQFFIAGLGGSAGGFEAFEEFFKNLPHDLGIGFVVVSHLDPVKKDILPELIQRFTSMPVLQAENDMVVLPNHVYIIPPNQDITLLGGVLKLHEQPATRRGIQMPIDTFLRSLAEDRQERAIAIIFSGMGSDGSLGIKAIKEKNGTVMVQDPSEAKFDSMPQSAINTGMVDYVALASDMPRLLVDFEKNYYELLSRKPEVGQKSSSDIEKMLTLIRRRTGHDFSEYKPSTIYRRIERRMTVHQIRELADYLAYLNAHPDEIDLLFKELLIGVTNFFRDPDAFDVLEKKAVPEMLKDVQPNSLIRVWVPGCSTGEEAYSIAMVLLEAMGDRPNKVQIFATDIDRDAIEYARRGIYPENIATDVSEERLKQFFTKEDGSYKVKKVIREMIIFAEQDVAHDPPFSGMDLISCRNLLIYMNQEMQNRIISLFAYSINAGGILFLGSSEGPGRMSDLFSVVDSKWKIYRRKEYATRREVQTIIPIATSNPIERMRIQAMGIRPPVGDMAHQALLEAFSPPAAIVDRNGDIAYIHGHTGKYLEPTQGKMNVNILSMARKGLGTELGIAIEKAKRDNTDVVLKGIEVQTNGHVQQVDVTVKPIRQPEAMKNFLIVSFQDVEPPTGTRKKIVTRGKRDKCDEVVEELRYTKDKLQNTMEEMHASQEELRSMNEEMQSTNEELQSTNEELSTSKEELQSLNEELMTVNSELQAKVDDLTRANNDIKNLLSSTDIATIFLNGSLNITRFTQAATNIVNLLPTDLGRPITDISTNLKNTDPGDDSIAKESSRVIETLATVEKLVETRDDFWYKMHILPYRTVDNVIDGVVITFSDVTDLKCYEQSLKESKDYAEAIIETIREPLVVLDDSMQVVTANRSFYDTFQVTPRETEGQFLFDLGNHQWDIPELKELLGNVLPNKKTFNDFKVIHDFPNIGPRRMMLNARKIDIGKKGLILLAIENIAD
jgi:two-component system CheB/CheR fusion protein